MKRITFILTLFICLFNNLDAQTYENYAMEMFLLTQPDARSEAMGRGSAVLYGSPFTNFYNPASSSFSRGVNAEVSHLELPYPFRPQKNYDVYGAGVNLGKYGSISFNHLRFLYGESYYNDENNPDMLITYKLISSISMLNYSHNIINGLSAGININYFTDNNFNIDVNGWTYDFGLQKKFSFESEKILHDLYLGLSFTNFTNTKIFLFGKEYTHLPSIMRIAAGYEFKPQGKVADYQIFKALLTTQYMHLLNTEEFSHFQLGTEITLFEMLNIRGGFFTVGLNNYDVNGFVKRLNEATYGFGIELPIKKISNMAIPLNIRFDHTSLPFPLYYPDSRKGDNCPIYTLNISYDL
ncbi:MAG: hypothetical protein Q8933_21330 [Bacteroidota bacterium]|nr:hypothetical protein [Bacteroidota bacterium]